MPLETLVFPESARIFRQTHRIWSAGLTIDDYLLYNSSQRKSIWGKKHLSLVGLEEEPGKIASSCKIYRLEAQVRRPVIETLKIWGLGAVFTPRDKRGQGHAASLLEQISDLAWENEVDALLLYSDIGAAFYRMQGYEELSAAIFCLHIPRDFSCPQGDFVVAPLHAVGSDYLERHYRQWLARAPLAIERQSSYFDYKINKENFLHQHSRHGWPELSALICGGSGYAILESGGAVLRVLEITAPEHLYLLYWQAILSHAVNIGARKIKGWEGVLAPLAPTFALDRFLAFGQGLSLDFSERGWGKPMLMPLSARAENISEISPCPFLELDHL